MLATLALLAPGLLLGWTLGGNDAANVFGPAVTTGRVRLRTIAALAGACAVLGATLQGGGGMATYGALADQTPATAAALSLAAALGALGFLVRGLPISVTQAVAGAIVGMALVREGSAGVDLAGLGRLVLAWGLAPPGAALLAFVLYRGTRPRLEPWLLGLTAYDRFIAVGFFAMAAYGAYALGANNVANVVGAYVQAGVVGPWAGGALGGLSIALGMMSGSRRVIDTVGRRITRLSSFGGLVVLGVEALALHLYAMIGVPISASQAIIGGIVGLGMAQGVGTVNREIVGKIVLSWVGGPLAGAALAAGFGLLLPT